MEQSDASSLQNPLLTTLEFASELPQELRLYLQRRLPEYMVPSFFLFLEDLPVTSSGKIDYQALPAPDQDLLEERAGYLAPRTELERSLAEIWCQTLELKQVGVKDNFFQIGGHSLLVTQIIARMRSVLQIELPLRILFEIPTIAGLAEHIESRTPGR